MITNFCLFWRRVGRGGRGRGEGDLSTNPSPRPMTSLGGPAAALCFRVASICYLRVSCEYLPNDCFYFAKKTTRFFPTFVHAATYLHVTWATSVYLCLRARTCIGARARMRVNYCFQTQEKPILDLTVVSSEPTRPPVLVERAITDWLVKTTQQLARSHKKMPADPGRNIATPVSFFFILPLIPAR